MCTGSLLKKQRCTDGVINDFLSRYRHVLVPLLFHEWHPYIPLHFREMIFPLVPLTFFIWGKSPIKMRCMDSNRKGDYRTQVSYNYNASLTLMQGEYEASNDLVSED